MERALFSGWWYWSTRISCCVSARADETGRPNGGTEVPRGYHEVSSGHVETRAEPVGARQVGHVVL